MHVGPKQGMEAFLRGTHAGADGDAFRVEPDPVIADGKEDGIPFFAGGDFDYPSLFVSDFRVLDRVLDERLDREIRDGEGRLLDVVDDGKFLPGFEAFEFDVIHDALDFLLERHESGIRAFNEGAEVAGKQADRAVPFLLAMAIAGLDRVRALKR